MTALAISVVALGARLAVSRPPRGTTSQGRPIGTALQFGLVACLAGTLLLAATRGVSGRAVIPQLAGPGAPNGYLALLPQLTFGLSLAMWRPRAGPRASALPLAGLLTTTAIFFASGTRYSFIVAAAAAYSVRQLSLTGRLPTWRAVPAALALSVLALGWIGVARSQTAFGREREASEAAISSAQIFLPQAAIVEYTERNGFELGATYSYTIVQVVPRATWADKPPNPIERLVDDIYPGSGIAFPIWGEWFLNFGWVGVGAFGLLFGYSTTRLWESWYRRRRRGDPRDVFAIVSCLLLINAVSRGYFVQAAYIYGAFVVAPWLLVCWSPSTLLGYRYHSKLQRAL